MNKHREYAEKVVRDMRVADREAALRQGLIYAGFCPRSVELGVQKNRAWIESMEPLEKGAER